MYLKIFIFGCLFNVVAIFAKSKTKVHIGVIFDTQQEEDKISFQYAVNQENINNKKFMLIAKNKTIDTSDSYLVEQTVCEIIEGGVAAIFGPNSLKSSSIVASICAKYGIPHFIGLWMPPEMDANRENWNFTRNLFPNPKIYSRALGEIVEDYDWKGFTVIYDDAHSLTRLHDVLGLHSPGEYIVTMHELPADSNYLEILKQIALSRESRILLDCSPDKVIEIIKQGLRVNLMQEYQNYIITSMDAHTLDFPEMSIVRSNITALRWLSSADFGILDDWQESTPNARIENIRTESVLLYDAVRIFSSALRQLVMIHQDIYPVRFTCSHETFNSHWVQGAEILKIIDGNTHRSNSGPVSFDEDGLRNDSFVEILELSHGNGFQKIATWDPTNKVTMIRAVGDFYKQIFENMQNKTFRIVSRKGMPFLREIEPTEGVILEGNKRYEGFSVDFIDAIAKDLKFKYEISLVPDNNYGNLDKETNEWNGLVKELLDRKADLALCDLTITYERRSAVDFTTPFMTLGISILYLKPHKEKPSLFSFMKPLSDSVWMYMSTAFLCMSIVLFLIAKIAAADWENPHPCVEDPDELESIWDMQNCIWLTVGSIMQQGCDILPKAVSTRLAAGIWWFFALIVISSYTANLAAFLTMERMEESIESAEDLARQNKIQYGVVKGGSTSSFFEHSNFSTYQRMWTVMSSTEPSVFTKSNDEGEERVRNGARMYAFLMESIPMEYITNRYCNLTKVGGLLDSKGYGIALPVNSPYRTMFNQAVLRMQEDGTVQTLKDKWWVELNTGGAESSGHCEEDASNSEDTPELDWDNVGGVFLVLTIGLLVSILIGVLEFIWNVRQVSIEEKITPYEAFQMEIRFAFNFRITKKPIRSTQDISSRKSSTSCESRKQIKFDE